MLTVYSKTNCPACINTKVLLGKYGVSYKEINMDENQAAKEFLVSEGHRQVPQIYRGTDLFIKGGWLGLMSLNEAEIKKMLYGD